MAQRRAVGARPLPSKAQQQQAQTQQQQKNTKSYFDELVGKRIEVVTRYVDDGSYHVFKGTFLGLEKGYLWLENVEVVTVRKDGTITNQHTYLRVALNEAIVSQVRVS